MNRESAKKRAEEIESEQKKLRIIGMPFQLIFFVVLIWNILSSNQILPPLITNEYLIYGLLFIAIAGFVWIHSKIWKLSKERDDILSKHGVW